MNQDFEELTTVEYQWKLKDNLGQEHILYLVGIEDITEEKVEHDISPLASEFP